MRRGPLALLLALSGCAVSYPDVLSDGFFACSAPEDCGSGQGCAEGNVYSADFCRPACDPDWPGTCPDGVCTAAGACLEGCTIDADGTASSCAGEAFTCVRTDAVRDEGVCYPVEGCSRTADCPREGAGPQLCLNDALGLPATTGGSSLRFDNLYCTGAPDVRGRCPEGYLSFRLTSSTGRTRNVCFAPCHLGEDDVPGAPFCPPATTCFRGVGELVGATDPPCVPGIWGMPCADDTQCLLGTCLPVGDGRRACTETCATAEAHVGGCDGLEQLGAVFGVATQMSCERVGEDDVCVPRYDLLSLCDGQLECTGGADVHCALAPVSATASAHLCLRACNEDADCFEGTGGSPGDYRCVPTASGGGVCSRRRPLGGRCGEDLDCRTGSCCELGEGLRACLSTCP